MRIAIGQLWQETNTFNPLRTTRDDFEQFGVVRGAELIERMAHTNELGGLIQSLRAWPQPPEIVPLVRLPAWPSGLATAETFDWLRDELLAAVRAALPLDALLLALHGAMVAEGFPDAEAEIVRRVRKVVGSGMPIAVTLDLHANIGQAMMIAAHACAKRNCAASCVINTPSAERLPPKYSLTTAPIILSAAATLKALNI